MTTAGAHATGSAARWLRRLRLALLALLVVPLLHYALVCATAAVPPRFVAQQAAVGKARDDPDRREIGQSYRRRRGQIVEVRLAGTPEQIGHAHARLLYPEMVRIEAAVQAELVERVPWAPLRWLLVDAARLRFRHLARATPLERQRELAAQAAAFAPDPFAGLMPTFQRFLFLHSLYDVMLSFEGAALVGCTSFVLTGPAARAGHTLLGRAFDFEGPAILDAEKAVFVVREEGAIPYASVSWPGFVGATTGLNARGLAVVIHGARASEPDPDGEPVAETVRQLLARAPDVATAVRLVQGRDPMVSHLLLLADGSGSAAVVERAPGHAAFVRRLHGGRLGLTNHFEGPLAADPKNERVRATTSTTARRRRLEELLANLPAGATVQQAVDLLRDKHAWGGAELPLGSRQAIDALIATHGVVMDVTARELWVGEGPHLAGRFVRFDVGALCAEGYRPDPHEPLVALPADDIMGDGRYEAWRRAGALHAVAP
ncbi:MAG: hypothetical protein HY744_30535 [Deltaproteobacteria bacterium]|nr:hypothetical protein [Deltaproteobacteria bacterium]